MRSLYTDDIAGTKSKPTILDKAYYKHQHEKQIQRSPRNPQKKFQYQWYVPLPKVQRPSYEHIPYRNTIKLISQHTGMDQSMHYDSLKKQNGFSQPIKAYRSSLLSQSGHSSIKKSNMSLGEIKDPYYPHRIRDQQDNSRSTKFTGNRNWNYEPKNQIYLPNPNSEYVSKWIKL